MSSAQIPQVSLDWWLALVTIVDAGGYAQAAKVLHKSQSSLTYAIQRLEEQLEVDVFEIQGRRAVLTAAGEALYRRSKVLVEEAARLEQTGREIARGWETELRLAAEIIFPTWMILECFETFSRERPDTRLELFETVLGGTEQAVASRRVDLAISTGVPPGFFAQVLMPVRAICVASPTHPLHALGREVTHEDLHAHTHLVVRDTGERRDREYGWINDRRWTVSAKATSIRAVCSGMGYSWFPEYAIRDELAAGVLAPLPLREGGVKAGVLHLVYADRDGAGPGTRRLAELLTQRVQSACLEVEGGS